jgi:hypothetical protein
VIIGGRMANGSLGALAVYDPDSLRWVTESTPVLPYGAPSPDAAEPRVGHTASRIGRHTLLVFGGADEHGRILDERQRCRLLQVCARACVCVCLCVRVRVSMCVRVCVRVCVCMRACGCGCARADVQCVRRAPTLSDARASCFRCERSFIVRPSHDAASRSRGRRRRRA